VNTLLLFGIVETFSPLIPLIIYFRKQPKKERWFIVLLIYLIVYVPLAAYSNVLQNQVKNNTIIYLIIGIITFCCFSLIIERILRKKKFKILNRIVIFLTILFFVVNALWWEGSDSFNSNSAALSGLILVAYCIYYYKLQLENPQNVFVEKQSSFWIVSGIFIYCGGNFFLFTFYHSLILDNENFALYAWGFVDLLILFMNIFFAKGIQCS
jgi:hypothetical protein